MNREIKFKVWDKLYKTWIYFDLFGGLPYEKHEEENIEVVQFTGLKSKSGVDIYEGDIVKTREMNRVTDLIDYGMIGLALSSPPQVRFEHGGFYPIAGWMQPEEMEWEIIGNIYENPELLINENLK